VASIVAVCISEKKGTVKKSVPEIILKENYGIIDDAHAGDGHRQVSLLAVESVDKLRDKIKGIEAGAFAENILTEGLILHNLPIEATLKIGEAVLKVTQIGKDCHNDGCVIKRQTGDCVMPREGIFASVVKSGIIKPHDTIKLIKPK